jgi:molybdenum cofactor synthesis domain-containing protein
MSIRAAVLTISDKGSRGERVDESGPALGRWLGARGVEVVAAAIIPDEQALIARALCEWADGGAVGLILTTGGTGLSPRDVTPEATAEVLERVIPGMAEAMRAASLKITPRAMLSRALCGVRGRALIVNLPGSPSAVVENIEAIWAVVPHAISKLQGATEDCAK